MLIPFNAIKGQDKAKQMLATAIRNGKTSHAYLFRGASGVGKKMMAHALAALINCRNPTSLECCATCPSCKKFQSDNHPDFQLIEPIGVGIKIDQIRTLQKSLAFPPFEAKTRVILLPDIHDTMRRPEVANGLLKTLEEPPEDTLIILTGDEAGSILPTILSRCQVIPFTPLPLPEVAELLTEGNLSKEQALTLAAIAEGSPGRAKHHLNKGFLELRTTITNLLCRAGSPHTVSEVYQLAKECSELKDDTTELLDLLGSWLRDLILLRLEGTEARLLNIDLDNLAEGAELWSTPALLTCLDALTTARKQLDRNCNRPQVFEVLFFALLSEKW
jgi:DNA polymerase-3 subunit delta'